MVRPDRKETAKLKPLRHPAVTLDGLVLIHEAARPTGWRGALATALRMPTTRRFELDEVGLAVWNACDGKTTFQAIAAKLQREFKLGRTEAEASLSAFLKILTERALITLEKPK